MTAAATAPSIEPACKNLVLDAGPLLSFSPLRNLSQTYYIVPQVISELKDQRAKSHFESLALNAGVRIQVRDPSPSSLAHSMYFFLNLIGDLPRD
jgi:RNA-binding protein NOB1